MILISTYFTAAKKSVEGYFDRYTWLKSNDIIIQLLDILKKKEADTKKTEDKVKIEDFNINKKQIFPALVNYMDKLQSQLHKAF
jgi:SET domain-containing protein